MLEELGSFYLQEGLQCVKERRITPAVEALEKAALLCKRDCRALNLLGLCYYRLGEFSRAKKAWEKSIQSLPEKNPALRYLEELQGVGFLYLYQKFNEAMVLAGEGRYKQAEKILLRKKISSFSFVSFTNLLGLCFYARGKEEKALRTWLKSLSLDREHPLTLKYLAQGFTEEKKQGLGRIFAFFQ